MQQCRRAGNVALDLWFALQWWWEPLQLHLCKLRFWWPVVARTVHFLSAALSAAAVLLIDGSCYYSDMETAPAVVRLLQ